MAVLLIGEDHEGNTAVFRGEKEALIRAAQTIANRQRVEQIASDKRMVMLFADSDFGGLNVGMDPIDTPDVIRTSGLPFYQLKVGPWYARVVDEAPFLTQGALDSFIQIEYDRRDI